MNHGGDPDQKQQQEQLFIYFSHNFSMHPEASAPIDSDGVTDKTRERGEVSGLKKTFRSLVYGGANSWNAPNY